MAFYCGFSNLFATTDFKGLRGKPGKSKKTDGRVGHFPPLFYLRFPGVSFLVSQTPTAKRARIRFRKISKGRL
jgi:hypothetical protein